MSTTPMATPRSQATTLHVHERGDAGAPRAVLVHSSGTSGSDMLDRFGLAVPGFHVLAPDRTNYGQSPASAPGGTGRSNGRVPDVAMIDDDAQEIALLLGDGAHLVGYSYGGVVALAVASRRPGLVRSLTLVEPPAFQLVPDDADALATVARVSAAIDTVHDSPDDYFAAFMSSMFGETFRIPLDVIPVDRKAASMREQVAWDLPLDLSAIAGARIPSLVVCGDWDAGFVAVARHLGHALSGQVLQLDSASHFFDGRWPAIAAELERFWREVDA